MLTASLQSMFFVPGQEIVCYNSDGKYNKISISAYALDLNWPFGAAILLEFI
jgi:hypothetical protein